MLFSQKGNDPFGLWSSIHVITQKDQSIRVLEREFLEQPGEFIQTAMDVAYNIALHRTTILSY